MMIRVFLFANLREMLGTSEMELDVEHGASVSDVVARLEAQHSGLQGHRFSTALNRAYVNGAQRVSEGDEIALIPPVSGG